MLDSVCIKAPQPAKKVVLEGAVFALLGQSLQRKKMILGGNKTRHEAMANKNLKKKVSHVPESTWGVWWYQRLLLAYQHGKCVNNKHSVWGEGNRVPWWENTIRTVWVFSWIHMVTRFPLCRQNFYLMLHFWLPRYCHCLFCLCLLCLDEWMN